MTTKYDPVKNCWYEEKESNAVGYEENIATNVIVGIVVMIISILVVISTL